MQTQTREPIVRSFQPTARFRTLMRIGNTFMRPLLRSRLGRRMDDLALLSFTGRRSGRLYTVPVGYHELDGHGVVMTASPWRANLRGGADVEVVHNGRRIPMRAESDRGPARRGAGLQRAAAEDRALEGEAGHRARSDRRPDPDRRGDRGSGGRPTIGRRAATTLRRPATSPMCRGRSSQCGRPDPSHGGSSLRCPVCSFDAGDDG